MTVLNYPRHFVLLVGASAVLALGLSLQPVWAPAPDRPLAPALWWLGFSVALCIADRRHAAASPGR